MNRFEEDGEREPGVCEREFLSIVDKIWKGEYRGAPEAYSTALSQAQRCFPRESSAFEIERFAVPGKAVDLVTTPGGAEKFTTTDEAERGENL